MGTIENDMDALHLVLNKNMVDLAGRMVLNDQGKEVFYALDEDEKEKIVKQLNSKNKQKKIEIQRFKGLGEMNPSQLRETTMELDGRRLLKLTLEKGNTSTSLMDMLLSKKRAGDRKNWLETKGDLASLNE